MGESARKTVKPNEDCCMVRTKSLQAAVSLLVISPILFGNNGTQICLLDQIAPPAPTATGFRDDVVQSPPAHRPDPRQRHSATNREPGEIERAQQCNLVARFQIEFQLGFRELVLDHRQLQLPDHAPHFGDLATVFRLDEIAIEMSGFVKDLPEEISACTQNVFPSVFSAMILFSRVVTSDSEKALRFSTIAKLLITIQAGTVGFSGIKIGLYCSLPRGYLQVSQSSC